MTQMAVPDRAVALREGLAAALRDLGALCSEAVGRAVLAVPRHVVMPEAVVKTTNGMKRTFVAPVSYAGEASIS